MDDTPYYRRLNNTLWAKDRKQAFFDLCDLYRQVDDNQRKHIRAHWPFQQKWSIPLFTAILIADTYPSEQRLYAALIFESIENVSGGDWRENLIDFALFHHCAIHIGLDPLSLFDEIAALSINPMKDLLHNFARRPPEDRNLAAFAHVEEHTPQGIFLRYDAATKGYNGQRYFDRKASAKERS